ncbi:MAG: isoprenylcysteine carboxylmethyltransferase family protein [Deltaproteobacteria bacterium]|nr:isoprenylcysteine carboxylmethyltransferase family protein [Deltaproteobacteria bacterium]
MEERMSRWGIGPVFAALSVAYGLVCMLLTYVFYPAFQMHVLPYRLMVAVGAALILVGLLFCVVSIVTVMRAYEGGRLVTGSVFACCRHPLYASWVVFIVPGIVFLFDSWIGLSAPVFMYALLRILVRKEEVYLEREFGAEYLEYKRRVPCIVPCGRALKR